MKLLKKFVVVVIITIAVLALAVYGGAFLGQKIFFQEKSIDIPANAPISDGHFLYGQAARPNNPAEKQRHTVLFPNKEVSHERAAGLGSI
jgi:hypothetical protein